MKKFNVILDETTIINFEFFFGLLKRYYITTITIPILVFCVAYYKLGQQTKYFSQTISLKTTQAGGESSSSLSDLLGEKSSGITPPEIIDITTSLDFRQELAEMIYALPNFKDLQFNKNKSNQFSYCKKEKKCVIHVLRGILSNIYSITESTNVESVMYLKYNSLNPITGKAVLQNVAKLIEKTRIGEIRHNIFNTKQITLKLIEEKKQSLKSAHYEKMIENKIKVVREMKTIEAEFKTVSNHLTRQRLQLQYAQSEFEQTAKVSRKLSSKEKRQSKKYVLLKSKIDEIRADIRAIESESKSENDSYILVQLKQDLKNKVRAIKKFKNIARLGSRQARFISSKDETVHSKKFNYQLIKTKINKLETKQEILLIKRSEHTSKLEKLTMKFNEYLPVVEYLSLLEKKVIQLDLLLATVVSDIAFAKNYTDIISYKKLKTNKTYIFSFVISLFIIFSLTFSRYLVDTKIYTEYEIEKNFEDIEIIGHTPDFK